MLTRKPHTPLHPWVLHLWATTPGPANAIAVFREAVLPTGAMHLAIRLSDSSLRVYGSPSGACPVFTGHAVIGGARQLHYIRDVGDAGASVGAMLGPNAAAKLFGIPATELAGRHTDLADLWGRDAERLRQQLAEIPDLARRLDHLETVLWGRLDATLKARFSTLSDELLHFASSHWAAGSSIAAVVRQSGFSHRHFVDQFRRATGLSPKAWCRVQRFQRALKCVAANSAGFCGIAHACGYSDQAHFNRDFRHFAGLSPAAYRQLAPLQPNHLPLPVAAGQFSSILHRSTCEKL